ncbi:Smr domain [Anaerotruncus sp. 2789STDY5834896]|uniref:Smr domain n=1 Tax=uncultured Anaerotruncus sp. TaxID=905011 RepID=A0A1C6ISJ6_9FIRM|nr:Smr domain [uncultured Anaerotruncus sp.]
MAVDTVNLEEGRPFVKEALEHMERALERSKKSGCKVLKFIHGYGSSGKGGKIKKAVRQRLGEKLADGELQAVIYGENFTLFDDDTQRALAKYYFLAGDSDMGRMNLGITFVVFK